MKVKTQKDRCFIYLLLFLIWWRHVKTKNTTNHLPLMRPVINNCPFFTEGKRKQRNKQFDCGSVRMVELILNLVNIRERWIIIWVAQTTWQLRIFPHSYHRIPDTALSRQASQIIIILFSFKSVKGRCRDTKAMQFIVSPFPPNLLVKPFINHSPSPGQPNQMTSKDERNKGDCFTSLTNDSIISIKTRS